MNYDIWVHQSLRKSRDGGLREPQAHLKRLSAVDISLTPVRQRTIRINCGLNYPLVLVLTQLGVLLLS